MYIPRFGLPTFMKKTASKVDVRALLSEPEEDDAGGFVFPEILAQSTHTHSGTISAGHALNLSDMQRAIEALSAPRRRTGDFTSGRWEGLEGFATEEGARQLEQYYAAAAARNDDHIRATMSLSYD